MTGRTIEQRMDDFVAAFGDLPDGAFPLPDYDARYHSDVWIQRVLGEGIVCDYVTGYQLGDKWWTFCFDRRDTAHGGDEEVWVIEAYDSAGGSSRGSYFYCPTLARWKRAPRDYWPASPGGSSGASASR